ncbi:MAG: hypothetical protein IJ282_07175 [Lachnospiraceae bacterium]|nr:hypothetical protein [Lachnospiraceae bacterium]
MDSARVMERMYYIIDGRGNYYRTNEEDQLIVSRDRETADLFELKEANKRINNGRKMYFYSILPADTGTCWQSKVQSEVAACREDGREDEKVKAVEMVETENDTASIYPYDLDRLDWKEYLLHFSYVVSGLKKYQDKLNNELSEVDMCICDLMHYLELYDLEDADYIKAADLIKQNREKRRGIKDKALMVDYFQKAIGTNANLAKAKEALTLINKLDHRTYKPRVLSEIFTDAQISTKRKKQFAQSEEECLTQKEENVVIMENMERRETVFDKGENDWGRFVSEQMGFFTDAKQYVCNLQITLSELDEEIEQVLYQIEEANYNVAQGYKVFKLLKDLRNERKKMAKELECVQTIAQCFDCEAMRDAYQYCADRINEIQGVV